MRVILNRIKFNIFLLAALGVGPFQAGAVEFGRGNVTFSYTPMVQSSLRSKDTNANGEIDIIGSLELSPDGPGHVGQTRLNFWVLGNHTIGGTTPAGAFSRGAGLLWDTNDGDAPDPEWALGVFSLRQEFDIPAGQLGLDVG